MRSLGTVSYVGHMTTQVEAPWYVNPWTRGDRFAKAREHTELDQHAFADLIGASRQTVSNYESGSIGRPLRAIVMAWARATTIRYVQTPQNHAAMAAMHLVA